MRRIPRAFIRRGEIVWPEDASKRRFKTLLKGDEALARLASLYKEHGHLYLVDVEGQQNGEASLDFYQSLERRQVFPWLDVGARRVEDVMDAFFAGADRVTVHLRHVAPERLREMRDLAEGEIHLGVGVEATQVEKRWSPASIVQYANDTRVDGVVLEASADARQWTVDGLAAQLDNGSIATTAAPWPGTRLPVDTTQFTNVLFDPRWS